MEIAKHVDGPSKMEALLGMFEERKKEAVEYRLGGVITLSVGLGIYLRGNTVMGRFFEAIGLLVGAIAGYFSPNTSMEISHVVERFEEKQTVGKHHKKLQNNLAERRKTADFPEQNLSENADVSRKSINAIDNGVYLPSTLLALKIAKTLNCTVEDLFQLP